jgi:hypothetical protein
MTEIGGNSSVQNPQWAFAVHDQADPSQDLLPLPGSDDTTYPEAYPIFPRDPKADRLPGKTKLTKSNGLVGSHELTPEEKAVVAKLQARDREVRAHEAAHMAAAGAAAAGGATYTYEIGPDGKAYAVGGEVSIRMPPGLSAEQALAVAEQIRAAALAPDQPSGQDMAVAAEAEQMEAQAWQEIAQKSTSSALAHQALAAYRQAALWSQPPLINATA